MSRAPRLAPTLRIVPRLALTIAGIFIISAGAVAFAADWSTPEQQLAKKIVAVTGNGSIAVTVENHSSLGRRDGDIIQNGLRSALSSMGAKLVAPEVANTPVRISLSENLTSYVWVAQIPQSGSDAMVVMVSMPRPASDTAGHDSVPLSLRKTLLWTQTDPILDLLVLDETSTPVHIAVLDARAVSLYRWEGGKWKLEQSLAISHARPWPRDLRGRVVPARDHQLDVYLPDVVCHSTAGKTDLNCNASDDPWPIGAAGQGGNGSANMGATNGEQMTAASRAFFSPSHNFFTGALTPPAGTVAAIDKFYSAAFLPQGPNSMWLFASVNGDIHVVEGSAERKGKWNWGSDLAGVRTPCGAGSQVLATASSDDGNDSVRAFEFPDRDPVAVSASTDFSGPISALWTEPKGDTAIAIAKNKETDNHEAYRLAVVCSQ